MYNRPEDTSVIKLPHESMCSVAVACARLSAVEARCTCSIVEGLARSCLGRLSAWASMDVPAARDIC